MVLRPARENTNWGYHRINGELASLGITVAPSAVWEILKSNHISPVPDRDRPTWALSSMAKPMPILAADFTVQTLTGAHLYTLAIIEHTTRRIRIFGATAHPTASWTTQMAATS